MPQSHRYRYETMSIDIDVDVDIYVGIGIGADVVSMSMFLSTPISMSPLIRISESGSCSRGRILARIFALLAEEKLME